MNHWAVTLFAAVSGCAAVLFFASRGYAAAAGRLAGRVLFYPGAKYYLAAGVFLTTAWLSWGPFRWYHHIADEAGFFLQARTYAAGKLYVPRLLPHHPIQREENENSFTSPLEAVIGDKVVLIYSPYYPAFLAVGVIAGLPWLPNAAFAAATVLLASAVAGAAWGERAAAAAAWLAASSPALVLKGATYFSEASFVFFYLAFLWAYLRAERRSAAIPWFLAGIFWGITFGVREYTALVGTFPFLIMWLAGVWRERPRFWFAPGVLAATMPLWFYNYAVTGNPFLFPRFLGPVIHFSFFRMNFTVVLARRLFALNNDALGWSYVSLTPAVAAAVMLRKDKLVKVLLVVVAATPVLCLPMLNWGVDFGTRYYIPAAAALVLLAALLIVRLEEGQAAGAERSWRRAVPALALCLIGCGFLNVAGLAWRETRPTVATARMERLWVTPALAEALRELGVHNAVVFVGPPPHGKGPMPNRPDFRDDVIFARDQGPRNVRVINLFPGRRFLRCDYREFERGGVLYEIHPPIIK